MRAFVILLSLVLSLSACSSGQKISHSGVVKETTATTPSHHGLWYYLPKTVVQVEMVAEKRVYKAGPFYRFSQRFLNVSDVVTQDKEEWVLVDAKITTFGKADHKRLFSVATSGQPALAALNLSQDGVLLSINHASNVKITNVYTKFPEEFISLKSVNFNDTPFSEEQLIKTSTTAMAEEVAKEIYRLRALRKDLLQGDLDLLPPDGIAYEKALADIDRLEKSYLQLFVGKKEVQRVSKFYDFTPEQSESLESVLLRFSDLNGFLDDKDVSGTPVYIEIEIKNGKKQNFIETEDVKDKSNRGLIYCQPATAVVKIIDRTLLLSSREVALAQFGQLLRMPADLLDSQKVGVVFNPSTGAIEQILLD
ncbi:MAG TPA: DUF4831 family protein [Marinilabiliaceae bacterium]|nr:DUF4831 family protein [Marinilabiliaceae bacterium]